MHRIIVLITTVMVLTSTSGSSPGDLYNGHMIIAATPKTPEEVQTLQSLEGFGVKFNFRLPSLNYSCDLLVEPSSVNPVLHLLTKAKIDYRVKVSDVGELIRSQNVSSTLHNGKISWDEYYTLEAIYEYLGEQVNQHPTLASLENIGITYEGRNLTLIKIANSVGTQPKPVVYIETNIHAREWITSAVGTHIIEQLLNGPDPEMQGLVDTFDFYILPVANPDGFTYTHSTDRLWRKTRSNTSSPLGCKGADPNRNFNAFWMENGGASPDPCSNTYGGSAPHSEPEVKAMTDFMLRTEINSNMVLYLSLHSSGQYLLIPTGLDENHIPEYEDYMRIAQAAAIAHTEVHGKNYTAGSIFDIMYPATGSSLDWAYLNVKNRANFHITYELRDKGEYGFLLPPPQILPTCEEFLAGFKVIMGFMA